MKKNFRLVLLGILTLCLGLFVLGRIFPDFGATISLRLIGGSIPALIKSGDRYLCQIAIDKIKKMSPPEKRSLVAFFKSELEAGPSQVKSTRPLEFISLLMNGDQIQQRFPGDVCFFMALHEVATVAEDLLQNLTRIDNFIGYDNQLNVASLVAVAKSHPDGLQIVAKYLDDSNPKAKSQAEMILMNAGDVGLKPIIARVSNQMSSVSALDQKLILGALNHAEAANNSVELKDLLLNEKLEIEFKKRILTILMSTYGKDKLPSSLVALHTELFPNFNIENTQFYVTNESVAAETNRMLKELVAIGPLYLSANWNKFGDIATKAGTLTFQVEAENKIRSGSKEKIDLQSLGSLFVALITRLEESRAPIDGIYSTLLRKVLDTHLVNFIGPYLLSLKAESERDKFVMALLLISPVASETLLEKALVKFRLLKPEVKHYVITFSNNNRLKVSNLVLEEFLDVTFESEEEIFFSFIDSNLRTNEPFIIYLNQKRAEQKSKLMYLAALIALNPKDSYRSQLSSQLNQNWLCKNSFYNSLIILLRSGDHTLAADESVIFGKFLSCSFDFLKTKNYWHPLGSSNSKLNEVLELAAKKETNSDKKKLFEKILSASEPQQPILNRGSRGKNGGGGMSTFSHENETEDDEVEQPATSPITLLPEVNSNYGAPPPKPK